MGVARWILLNFGHLRDGTSIQPSNWWKLLLLVRTVYWLLHPSCMKLLLAFVLLPYFSKLNLSRGNLNVACKIWFLPPFFAGYFEIAKQQPRIPFSDPVRLRGSVASGQSPCWTAWPVGSLIRRLNALRYEWTRLPLTNESTPLMRGFFNNKRLFASDIVSFFISVSVGGSPDDLWVYIQIQF